MKDVIEPALPVVAFDTPVEKLSPLINKGNGAILSKDDAVHHIVTKYDVLQALGK